jgi:hypothetical protein
MHRPLAESLKTHRRLQGRRRLNRPSPLQGGAAQMFAL